MRVIHAQEPFPTTWSASVFLLGPTPRASRSAPSWRPDAIAALREAGFPDDGVVLLPEPRDGVWPSEYTQKIEWEQRGLTLCDVALAWVPRDLHTMPGFTTNTEIGELLQTGKLVLGAPAGAKQVLYQKTRLEMVTDNTQTLLGSLVECAREVVRRLDGGAIRSDGERFIPIHIWRHRTFQDWYRAHKAVGNRLDEARQLWLFKIWTADFVLAWALRVKVWVAAENRHKENEFILGRPDISTVLLYAPARAQPGVDGLDALLGTEVVVVREFRSPCANADGGLVLELAGGSSFKPDRDPAQVASSETLEETGLSIPPERFRKIAARQMASTLSVHKAHLFSAQLTREEIERARQMAAEKTAHGEASSSEQTYVEVCELRELLASELMDWAMLGMAFQGALASLAP